MNGGVSLAVWMSGVTREIDALQHAHEAVPAEATSAQETYLTVWQDVLSAARRSRVRVDLVAGTSAGGLNGALLASAIARGERLDSELRDLWVEAGSLMVGKLIQRKDSEENSLLGGAYFEQQIATALGLVKDAFGAFTMAGKAVGQQNCTLLTTATALRTPGADDIGPDSRRVYRFTHRVDPEGVAATPGWAQSDFATHAAALARAARASASFPAAFNPVFESPDLVSRRHERIDDDASYLVDGGVLDNAPFGPLLDELRKRPIDAPFDRILLYIKPSAGGDGTPTPLTNNPSPLTVLGRVFTASREPDDRQDVEDLVGLRDEMLYTGTMPHLLLSRSFEPGSSMSGDALTAAATPLLAHYRRGRRQAFEVQADLEPTVRFDVPDITPLPEEGDLFGAMMLDLARGSWTWGLSAADRILRWWGRILNGSTEAQGPTCDAAFATVSAGQRLTTVLYESDDESWPADTTIATLAELMWTAADAMATWISGTGRSVSGEEVMTSSLCVEVLTMSFAWGHLDSSNVPRFSYRQITPGVSPLVNLEGDGESPYWERAHLYGSRWGHFGAFGADDWRASDWLWGRLDGARQLIELLVDPGDEREDLLQRMGAAILDEEKTTLTAVQASASSVRNATAASLWKEFVTELGSPTRQAIFAKLERLPSQNLPPDVAVMVLAAVGRERPESTKATWLARRKENARLRIIRAAFAVPRVYLRHRVRKALSSS
ncbi:DUF3376 domain-containing protein [Nocardioides sp.]|uniref:DUF3376 domain-containing protein n=1 Tax=Nocardioides sp. TaxID=35761 RepID=UPI0035B42E16